MGWEAGMLFLQHVDMLLKSQNLVYWGLFAQTRNEATRFCLGKYKDSWIQWHQAQLNVKTFIWHMAKQEKDEGFVRIFIMYLHKCKLYRYTYYLSLSTWDTTSALLFWSLVASPSLCVAFLSLIKAWGRSASSTAILFTQPPRPRLSVGGVFLARLPLARYCATCDSSGTWPSQHRSPLQASFPWLSENTPQHAWHVMFLLGPKPTTPNDSEAHTCTQPHIHV